MRCCGLPPTPSREFAPAGDLLSCTRKKVGKERAPAKPARRAALRCSKPRARPELASLRSAQTTVRSQMLKRAAHAPWASALLGGLEGESPKQPNSQQPNPQAGWRRLFIHPPFSAAEEHRASRPCAQRTSSSDSAQLFERSVAKRVLRGASTTAHRRGPEAQRRAVRSGATFCLLFGRSKRRSPAGANSRLGLAIKQEQRQALQAQIT
jgi:hypothetical protein